MLTGGKHQRFWLLEVTKLDKKNGMCLLFSWIVADSDWLITQGMKINICTDFTKCRSYAENAAGSFWSSVRLNSDLWLIRDKEYKDSFYLRYWNYVQWMVEETAIGLFASIHSLWQWSICQKQSIPVASFLHFPTPLCAKKKESFLLVVDALQVSSDCGTAGELCWGRD